MLYEDWITTRYPLNRHYSIEGALAKTWSHLESHTWVCKSIAHPVQVGNTVIAAGKMFLRCPVLDAYQTAA